MNQSQKAFMIKRIDGIQSEKAVQIDKQCGLQLDNDQIDAMIAKELDAIPDKQKINLYKKAVVTHSSYGIWDKKGDVKVVSVDAKCRVNIDLTLKTHLPKTAKCLDALAAEQARLRREWSSRISLLNRESVNVKDMVMFGTDREAYDILRSFESKQF